MAMRRGGVWRTVLGLLLVAVIAGACSSPGGDGSVPTRGAPTSGAATPVSVDRTGEQVFAATCAACHGTYGEGHPTWRIPNDDGLLPPPPLNGDGHTWHHADGLLYRIVSRGGGIPGYRSGMPAFGDQLSHQEIINVVTYVKSLWGDKSFQGNSILETQQLLSENDPFPPAGS